MRNTAMKSVSILALALGVDLFATAVHATALDEGAFATAMIEWRQQEVGCQPDERNPDMIMVELVKCQFGTVPEQLARARVDFAGHVAAVRREALDVARQCDAGVISQQVCVSRLDEISKAVDDVLYAKAVALRAQIERTQQDLADRHEFLQRLEDILRRARQNSVPRFAPPPGGFGARPPITTFCNQTGTDGSFTCQTE